MSEPLVRLPKGLMARLARSLGVDLPALQEKGEISPDAVARMQNHCSACSDPEGCRRLIDCVGGRMKEPPAFCPNKNIFLALKTGVHGRKPKK